MSSSAFAGRDPSGWLWYKDPPHKIEATPTREKRRPSSLPTPKKSPTAVERLAVLQKHFEEVKARAVLNPTLDNVAETRRLHGTILTLASGFEESWMMAELLDRKTHAPLTSPGALTVQKDQEGRALKRDLKALARTHSLLLLFDHGCPYCEAFAPMAAEFARTHGFELSGLSATPGSLGAMPCHTNKRAFDRLNPGGSVPLLLLINPETGDLVPLAQGYINEQALRQNARWAVQYLRSRS
jgi:conjugal transfer pilus assembly protein TraF